MQLELEIQLGVVVSLSCLCKYLHKAGFTHQRMSKYVIQRDEDQRQQLIDDVSI